LLITCILLSDALEVVGDFKGLKGVIDQTSIPNLVTPQQCENLDKSHDISAYLSLRSPLSPLPPPSLFINRRGTTPFLKSVEWLVWATMELECVLLARYPADILGHRGARPRGPVV